VQIKYFRKKEATILDKINKRIYFLCCIIFIKYLINFILKSHPLPKAPLIYVVFLELHVLKQITFYKLDSDFLIFNKFSFMQSRMYLKTTNYKLLSFNTFFKLANLLRRFLILLLSRKGILIRKNRFIKSRRAKKRGQKTIICSL
ncbi:hypothetical protein H312_01568, partial [Anncaliia algerae PRA339]